MPPRIILAAIALSSALNAADPISFSRQIRPILSENCFTCHGPDEKRREAKLRLDDETVAKATREDVTAIVPGHPERSEIIKRIESTDADEVMPPPKTHKTVPPEQLALLKQWIKEGAHWGRHWSYETVSRPQVPKMPGAADANPIDAFLARRLAQEHLDFAPPADAATLTRRLALDLTGLPPTSEEVEQFTAGNRPAASSIIQHFLDKPAFGEHWARLWLDLARYADSSGYPSDQPREIWAYRDWVIRALNANMPFDQFTIEQIAGDLLPNPTEDQLVATAFHRNTMTQNEGGTSDEEFRNAAIIDRVNTTMAVWMGTSMACAQCHSHKYDPITNEEYFRFFAILNQSADADRKDESPLYEFYPPPVKASIDTWGQELAAIESRLAHPNARMKAGLEQWSADHAGGIAWQQPKPGKASRQSKLPALIRDDATIIAAKAADKDSQTIELPVAGGDITAVRIETFPSPDHGNFVITDVKAMLVPPAAAPARTARFVRVELPGAKKFLHLAEVQVFSNGVNVALKGKATQSSQYASATAKLAIDGNTDGIYKNNSVAHTSEQANPWWEVDLGSEQVIERIVVWNRTDGNVGGRLEGFVVSTLDSQRSPTWKGDPQAAPKRDKAFAPGGPASVVFAQAFADYEQSGFTAASLLASDARQKKGWAVGGATDKPHTLTLLAAAPVKAAAGSVLRVTLAQNSEFARHVLGSFRVSYTTDPRASEAAGLPPVVLAALNTPPSQRTAEQNKALTDHYVRTVSPQTAPDRKRILVLKKEIAAARPNSVPIMKELTGDQRRVTKVQLRGNWQALGGAVTEGTPAALHPLPADTAPNRLALAKWLVDRQNPLTARVIMNRLWEQLFGVGIVRTSEEFGSQGELPVHPELLDWLAAEFMDSGWDMKHMIALMAGSRAYQQNSRVTKELEELDPDNRLLARGPRFRPTGELLRDQSLAVSGLLSAKMFGPPVRPEAPSLGLSTAFGRGNDWTTSEGEDKHRRSVYTEVRRNSPYASFVTFDAPNREVCTLRRSRTNTPLQAFVTLNDPVFVECAQAMARRTVSEGGGSDDSRLQWLVQTCMCRAATSAEVDRLGRLLAESRTTFKADADRATKLATLPLGPLAAGQDAAEIAAWTTVANVVMNLDEFVMRR